MRASVVLVLLCAACSESTDPVDLCTLPRSSAGGSVEVGVGSVFTPIADREEVRVELGLQGLYMFVANTRVRDMQIGANELGAIEVVALAETADDYLSLEVGCRQREFVDHSDGVELATPFWVALRPELNNKLDGLAVRLRATVRDRDGLEAIDERTVIARLPSAP